jgi:hypothetical protein
VLILFSLVSMLSFSGIGASVGWRIRRLARATGGAPERWIARCLLGICALGYPLALASQLTPPGAARVVLVTLGVGAIDFGLFCVYLFTRAVFRPQLGWLRFVLALPAMALAAHLVGLFASLWGARTDVDAMTSAGAPWTLVSAAVSGAGFAWTAAEALRYFAMLRRRVALGLADPLVANRMLLWGLVGISTTAINFANAGAALRGLNVLRDPPTMIATGLLGVFNALCLWLAFLPPERWARTVRKRAELARR